MADINVFNPNGELGTIPEEQLVQAQRLGYAVASPADVQLEKVKAEYGTIPNQIGAAVTGVASGLTLGLSDVALAGLGADEALKAYETLYPETRTAGTVVGAVLPALLSAGATVPESGLGLAARVAARSPAALAQAAGEATVARLGLAEAAGLTQGIGRTAARWATQAGVENALQGVGQETARLAIDNELSGEKIGQIATAGLTSGLTGIGIGAGLGVLGGAANRAYAAIPRELEGTPIGQRIQQQLLRTRARMAGLSAADAEQAALLATPEWRNIALDADNVIAEVIAGPQAGPLERRVAQVGSMQDDLDRKFLGQQVTAQAIRDGNLKIELVRGNVLDNADALIAQRDFATTELLQSIDEIDRALAAGRYEFAPTGLAQLRHELTSAVEAADTAMARGGTAGAEDLYGALDVMAKRAIGRATSRFERIGNPTGADMNTMRDLLEPMYERFRTGLENRSLWGRAAELQSEMNAPMTRAISSNEALLSNWYEKTPFGADPTNPWRRARVASNTKIAENIRNATRPGTDFADRALREQIANEIQWQDAALRLGNFENMGELRAAFEDQAVLNNRILRHQDRATQAALAKNLIDEISGGSDSFVGAVLGSSLATGNVALGALFAPLMKPRMMLRGAQMVENIANGQAGRIGAAVRRAATAVNDGAVAIAESAPTAGAALARYDQRSKRVKELSTQAPIVRQRLEEQTSWMADQAPRARQAAVATGLRQIDYLNKNLPSSVASPTPFASPLPPTRQQVHTWLNRLRAIENPSSILDDFSKGKLTPEAVDAVRAVYPETFADIQSQMLERLGALQGKKKAPAYAQRIQLGLLLGIPSDPTMTPEVMQAVQGSYAAQPNATREGAAGPAPQQGQKAPNIAAGFRSGSEETELTSGAQ